MQNKKSLLQRMLVIYITFFVVLVAGITQNILPDFAKGYRDGVTIGEDIARKWALGEPRHVFLLGDIPIAQSINYNIKGLDSLSSTKIQSSVTHLDITVDMPAERNTNPMTIAFGIIGGNPWLYLLIMLEATSYIVVIILMLLIIHSIRRSIKEERTLNSRNVWFIRTIGILTIFSELSNNFVNWCMNNRAAELLADSNLVVNTTFTTSFATLITGILIIFTAEVFAIGQNLSEEQKLTI